MKAQNVHEEKDKNSFGFFFPRQKEDIVCLHSLGSSAVFLLVSHIYLFITGIYLSSLCAMRWGMDQTTAADGLETEILREIWKI